MSSAATLKRFFEEKDLEHRTYSIKHNGSVHMIEYDFLIDVITKHTPDHEQKKILGIIVQIDFKNGDIHHFLEQLATGYVKTNY
ncbi:hypothetical protein AB4Z17_30060 [Paenibacillus sp. TAF43_2]|uniref:hypothetical protein n=1 Tax=Paenibacillus sp. TAF43_2 TaxID=3233069 RepID=UPI003F94D724